ncbi:xanthine dehydrogenase family protein subunit M [Shinella sp. CPCC 101442]|uniref:FAD binding domain-containing protein n=1 Tax=Shinella sp. CPCC 101442 TaxID=2932265 RepID=UPI0021534282|nr:xanthine dehydrogenase family protein subunit M [Shinella sp. CPCC 101442]MCR6502930.1 xanthine dehydrogenase family protein subunit M [Shinella sp. CPCC 101442]
MQPITYERPETVEAAVRALGRPETLFVAGGTTVFDLMKVNVLKASHLVDVTRLRDPRLSAIEVSDTAIRLGALVRMADLAAHPGIRAICPLIPLSLDLGASEQIRNMARLGGNVLQRTRCAYFRDTSFEACNKRNPGSGCAALDGHNRQHAILGTSTACIAIYPGDFPQVLAAVDAQVEIAGRQGKPRTIPFTDLHRLPGETPDVETVLKRDELITGFLIPRGPWLRRSLYLKIRDRQSYAFALASAAVALDLAPDGTVREARVGLGGVATVPWRAREAEAALKGNALTEAIAHRAAEAAFAGAVTRSHNHYKIPLGKQTLVRALLGAAAMEV